MSDLSDQQSIGDRRMRLAALFGIYLLLLVWLVLWKFEVPFIGRDGSRTIKLVPFVASGGDGASAPSEVLANVLIFVPFGLYLGLLAPTWRWWTSGGVVAGASVTIEVTQYAMAT